MIDRMTLLTSDSFRDFISGNDCLLLVYKKLCPHCKVLMAVIEKILPGHPGLRVAGIDSEEQPGALQALDVSKVPTVLVFKGGDVSARRSGVMNPAELSALIARPKAG